MYAKTNSRLIQIRVCVFKEVNQLIEALLLLNWSTGVQRFPRTGAEKHSCKLSPSITNKIKRIMTMYTPTI